MKKEMEKQKQKRKKPEAKSKEPAVIWKKEGKAKKR